MRGEGCGGYLKSKGQGGGLAAPVRGPLPFNFTSIRDMYIDKSQTKDLYVEASCRQAEGLPRKGAINEAQRQRRVTNIIVWNNIIVLKRYIQ